MSSEYKYEFTFRRHFKHIAARFLLGMFPSVAVLFLEKSKPKLSVVFSVSVLYTKLFIERLSL